MRASLALRSLRAGMFAAVCTALAAAAHILSMQAVPGAASVAVGFAVVGVFGFLAGSHEQSMRAIGCAMGLVQVGLHLLFDATMPVPGPAMAGMHGMTGMQDMQTMPGMADMAGMPAMAGMAGMSGPAVGAAHHAMSSQAVAAHALAALLAAWWLRRGEAALWSLLRHAAALAPCLTTWLRAWITPSVEPPDLFGAGHGWRAASGPRFHLMLRHAVIRRGPPSAGPVLVPTV
ncbi:hypothetical protein [Streptacidiphilus cavernicola]|uniref:PE-PGRS family protein n=1 Tax=Streptacidiphilus cavernicola TaxID=3342716 RepID=A0ABV6VZB0_9ACTN